MDKFMNIEMIVKKSGVLFNKDNGTNILIENLDGYDIKNIGNTIFQNVYNIIKCFEKDNNKEIITLTLADLSHNFKLNYFNVENKDFTKVMGIAKSSGLILSTITSLGIPIYKYLNKNNLEKLSEKIINEHVDILKSYVSNNNDKWDCVISKIITQINVQFEVSKKLNFKC